MKLLHDTILLGIPENRLEMPDSIRNFHQYGIDMYILDGVVMYGDRIVIPPKLRDNIMETIHSAHQGTSSMQS